MDSIPQNLLNRWRRSSELVIHAAPTEKDETDLELAVAYLKRQLRKKTALQKSHRPIRIDVLGAIGGRLDHTLTNLSLLESLGRPTRLIQLNSDAWIIPARERIIARGKPNGEMSLIPLTPSVRIKKTTGLKWPLKNESLYRRKGRGMSNRLVSERFSIEVDSGSLLLIEGRSGE